jgi:glucose/arabinose dehydrogenase
MSVRILQGVLLAGLAACGSSQGQSQAGQSPGTASTQAVTDSFSTRAVATFDEPWGMTFLPGSGVPLTNQALVTEKPGKLWLVDVATGKKVEVSGVPAVRYGGQGGLLDVAAAPDFAGSRMVYLTYSKPTSDGGGGLALARAELVQGSEAPRLENVQVLWSDPAGGEGGQFGGRIAFAPDGQSLFLSSGERQRFTPAQDASQPLGKILHLTLDGKPAPGNPWAGKTGAATVTITDPPEDTQAAKGAPGRSFTWPGPNLTPAETWTSGHRNPYGLAFAPDGRLWETEMGPQGGDELNLIEPGKNYGWPVVSNGENYNDVPIADSGTKPQFEAPKLFWVPSVSPGGLLIYSGDLFKGWKGDAIIPTLSGEALIRVDIDGDKASKAKQWPMNARIRSAVQGPSGEIYLLEDGKGGRLLRLDPDQARR